MIAKIDSQLDGNDCPKCNMEFRDNPADPCEVQYSNDGETWQTMFRKDTCPVNAAPTEQDITNIYNDIDSINTNNTTWNGDITNIAPKWAYVDENSDNALCWAIDFYVDWICDVAIKQIQSDNQNRRDENEWVDDVAAILAGGVIASIAALATTPITLPVIAIGIITWSTTRIVDEVWDWLASYSYDRFTNMDARQAVKCWMWYAVRGETPQFEDWSHSLDDFIGDNDDETAIAGAVAEHNSDEDIYINYMLLMEELNDIADSLPECDCPSELTIDQLAGPTQTELYGTRFTATSDKAFSNPGDDQATCPGWYDSANDRYLQVVSDIGGVGENIRVSLPPNMLVQKVQVHWWGYRTTSTQGGDKNCGLWLGDPTDGGTYIGGNSWGTGENQWQDIVTEIYDVDGIVPTPETHLYIHNSMDRGAGLCRITWIHIELKVYDP
ncbi:unnamed protein product [marine sediment metagenome]|uniref:Uncharacterized protein n=1 Tax=marine sediment metagenome TaxID=412755 RepID=X1A7Z5_9ZZZZ